MRQAAKHVGLGVVLIFGLLVGGCGQELKKENEQLKSQVALLQKENADLKSEIMTLKGDNEAMKKQLDEVKQIIDRMEAQKKSAKPAKKK